MKIGGFSSFWPSPKTGLKTNCLQKSPNADKSEQKADNHG